MEKKKNPFNSKCIALPMYISHGFTSKSWWHVFIFPMMMCTLSLTFPFERHVLDIMAVGKYCQYLK